MLTAVSGFETACITERLSNGPTNSSFRIERGGTSFVLRRDKPEAQRIGLDRDNENSVYEQLADHGLAPAIVHFDSGNGIQIRSWVEGRPWNETDIMNPVQLQRLAVLLRSLHELPVAARQFDPLEAIRRYSSELDNVQAYAVLRRAEDLSASEGGERDKQSLCHNDLVFQNILEPAIDGLPRLIDWEYAGLGDPFFDLAIVVQHHHLSRELALGFLQVYLDSPPARSDLAGLEHQCRLYSCLLELWNLKTQSNLP